MWTGFCLREGYSWSLKAGFNSLTMTVRAGQSQALMGELKLQRTKIDERKKKTKNQQNPPNSQPLVLQLMGNCLLFVRCAVRAPALTTRDGQCGDQAMGLVSGQDNREGPPARPFSTSSPLSHPSTPLQSGEELPSLAQHPPPKPWEERGSD